MKNLALLLLAPLALSGCASEEPSDDTTAAYASSVDAWHAERVSKLRSETGWLTLAGLYKLDEGTHSLGSAAGNDLVLAAAPAETIGEVTVSEGDVVFIANTAATTNVFGDDTAGPVETLPLVSDGGGTPTVLTSGTLLFHVIERGGELFLRVRDRNSPTLREFDGIERFGVDPRWRVTATLVPEPGATLAITNVLGQIETSPCPGALEFELEGQSHRLRPTVGADGSLFIVFGDTTNGKQTYGAGRFLDADAIDADGRVELDFNKAYNPVCSMSEFATCPLPPAGNRLNIPVAAGEQHGN